jgi:hypothetical protein
MIHDVFDGMPSRRSMRSRLQYGQRHVSAEIPVESFESACTNFNRAAEAFVVSLSDEVHRTFAHRYLEYLENIARGTKINKPEGFGLGPAARLIRGELDRLYDLNFLSTDSLIAA